MRAAAAAMVAMSLAGPALAGEVVVEEAWIRAAPPTVKVMAGYMTLHNASDEPKTLTGAESRQFDRVELHQTRMENGMMRMVAVKRLEIAPGERVHLEPGGLHLMMMRPHRPLAKGDHATVTLKFEDGEAIILDMPVRADGEMAPHGHHHHH